jgi:P4 family phage/plasmid primase-like protien
MTSATSAQVDRDAMRHYLKELWGTWDDPACGVLPFWDATTKGSIFLPIHDPAASADLAAQRVERGWSGHVGLALQPRTPTSGRGKEDATCAIAGLWFDLDVRGPAHRQEALPPDAAAATALIRKSVRPEPSLLVDSGHGLHAYWLLREVWDFRLGDDTAAERCRARRLSDQLQRAIRHGGRREGYEIESTSDLGRVLRIPGSLNAKLPDDPRPVRVLRENGPRYGIEELEETLPAVPPDERRDAPRPFTGAEFPAELTPIMDGCAFMRHCRDNAPHLGCQKWHASLTIVARCEDGERHAHDLSAPYPRYDQAETQAKYDDARAGNKPYRCATIATLSAEAAAGCAACAHRGAISTPVQLGRPRPTRSPLTGTVPLGVVGAPAAIGGTNGRRTATDEPGESRRPNQPADDQRRNLTDLGNAERLAEAHSHDLRYSHQLARWFAWDGKRWAEDDSGAVMRRAKRTARDIYVEASGVQDSDRGRAIAKHAMASQSATKLKAMIELAQSEPGIPIDTGALDQDPWLLNVDNGIIDLRVGELRPHRRGAYLSKMAPVAYDPDARCDAFLAFLERIMGGDDDLIGFLQRAAGYSLTGITTERALFVLHGGGRNGKTTLVEAISGVLGPDYADRTATDSLLARRFEQIPNDLAALRGKRFVSASEVQQGRRLDEAKVKAITGGDTITARFMRGEWFSYRPQFKLWLSTNHKPVIRGTDDAIWDRLRLIPFDVRIPDDEVDRSLGAKLRDEAPGILAWMVDGCRIWQERGLSPPAKVLHATQAYRSEMDVLGAFLSDCCHLTEGAWATAGDLYSAYSTWAAEYGTAPISKIALGRQLADRGLEDGRTTGGTRIWKGIGILPAETTARARAE